MGHFALLKMLLLLLWFCWGENFKTGAKMLFVNIKNVMKGEEFCNCVTPAKFNHWYVLEDFYSWPSKETWKILSWPKCLQHWGLESEQGPYIERYKYIINIYMSVMMSWETLFEIALDTHINITDIKKTNQCICLKHLHSHDFIKSTYYWWWEYVHSNRKMSKKHC